jgi:hypothetical protein
MAQAISTRLHAGSRRRDISDFADRAMLCLLRTILVLFLTYDGTLIVRNVTHALCDATGQRAPVWTTAHG